MIKTTLIVGASENPSRYSHIATKMLLDYQFPVITFGQKAGNIESIEIETEFPKNNNIHTVSLYIGAKNQPDYYQKIISLNPKRVIFNPGTENPEFESLLTQNHINFEIACTLVMLRTGQF